MKVVDFFTEDKPLVTLQQIYLFVYYLLLFILWTCVTSEKSICVFPNLQYQDQSYGGFGCHGYRRSQFTSS